MRRTAHRAKPDPTPSPPSVDDITGPRPSDDGATTAPRPATTNGPDPTARPTWSPRAAPSPSRPTDPRTVTRPPPGDPAPAGGGAGRRGVPRRRSVKATRGGTPQSNRDGPGDGDASRRGEPSAADVVRRTAPHRPHRTAPHRRRPHSPGPTALVSHHAPRKPRPTHRTAPNQPHRTAPKRSGGEIPSPEGIHGWQARPHGGGSGVQLAHGRAVAVLLVTSKIISAATIAEAILVK